MDNYTDMMGLFAIRPSFFNFSFSVSCIYMYIHNVVNKMGGGSYPTAGGGTIESMIYFQ